MELSAHFIRGIILGQYKNLDVHIYNQLMDFPLLSRISAGSNIANLYP